MQRYNPRTGKITYHQWRDSDGVGLEPGDEVAYNRSGTVTRGTIQKITPSGTTHILNTGEYKGWRDKVSIVKNAGDLLKIGP